MDGGLDWEKGRRVAVFNKRQNLDIDAEVASSDVQTGLTWTWTWTDDLEIETNNCIP